MTKDQDIELGEFIKFVEQLYERSLCDLETEHLCPASQQYVLLAMSQLTQVIATLKLAKLFQAESLMAGRRARGL
jgi:hypothetical protein